MSDILLFSLGTVIVIIFAIVGFFCTLYFLHEKDIEEKKQQHRKLEDTIRRVIRDVENEKHRY